MPLMALTHFGAFLNSGIKIVPKTLTIYLVSR